MVLQMARFYFYFYCCVLAPAQGFASLEGPATEQGGGRALCARVFCGALVSTPRHFPFLVCHIQAKVGVTSSSQKGNMSRGPGGSRQECLVRKSGHKLSFPPGFATYKPETKVPAVSIL